MTRLHWRLARLGAALLLALSLALSAAGTTLAQSADQAIAVSPTQAARADAIAFAGAGFAPELTFTADFIDPAGGVWNYFLPDDPNPAVVVVGPDGFWAVLWSLNRDAVSTAPLGTWTALFTPQDGSGDFWTVKFDYLS